MQVVINDVLLRLSAKLWAEIASFQFPADTVLSQFFREQRKLGVKERAFMADTMYGLLRNYYKLTKMVPLTKPLELICYTWLHVLDIPASTLATLKSVKLTEVLNLVKPSTDIVELPSWVIECLMLYYSIDEIKQLSDAMLNPAPLTLRINKLKTNRDFVLSELNQLALAAEVTKFSPYGVKLKDKTSLARNSLFLDGLVEVQDEASQLAAMLLEPKQTDMVVDFCAGSGGKTLALGMLMKNRGRIYAFDVNERRLGNLTPRLARSGLSNVYPQLINNENDIKVKRLMGKIDRVFVDAPCLGLGTIRRNPDIKFRQSPQSLLEITHKQQAILNSAARLLKAGGRLVYATCSMLREENQIIVANFLQLHPEFEIIQINQILKLDGLQLKDLNYLELLPHMHDTDGFFACVLQKKE